MGVGDVHGRLNELIDLLRAADLIGEDLGWTGGEGHLVMCGDLIDRGPDDREVLDLVHRLQGEAKKAGSVAHALLGNHEVMNLLRDLPYVSRESHLAFTKEERASDRKKAWRGFRKAYASPTPGTHRAWVPTRSTEKRTLPSFESDSYIG